MSGNMECDYQFDKKGNEDHLLSNEEVGDKLLTTKDVIKTQQGGVVAATGAVERVIKAVDEDLAMIKERQKFIKYVQSCLEIT